MTPQITLQSISRVNDATLKVEVKVVIRETGSTYNFNRNVPANASGGLAVSMKIALQGLARELAAIAEVANSGAFR